MALNLGDLFYNISADYKSVTKAFNEVEKLEKKVKKPRKPLNIEANDNDIVEANKHIDKLDRNIDKLTDSAEQSSNTIKSSFISMKGAIIGVSLATTAATIAIGKFAIDAGRPIEQAEARLRNMLGSTEDAARSLEILREQAYLTGGDVVSLADNFAKMTVFVNSGQISLNEATELSIGLSNALTALGGDANNLGNIMYGLSQAMGSGVVRAEEFNQVMEPLPGLLNRVEQSNKMAAGSLRKMINDGDVTSDKFKNLLIPALKSFQTEANNMSNTLSANQGKMSATFQALGEDIYEGIRDPLNDSIKALDDLMQKFVSVKRASGDELRRRLEENKKQRESLTSEETVSPFMMALASASGARLDKTSIATDKIKKERLDALVDQRKKILNQLNQIDPIGPVFKPKNNESGNEEDKGGNGENGKAEAKRALQERLQLQQQYAQLETDLIQGKFEQQEALARQKYAQRQALIGEFETSNIATQYERNQLSLQSEVELNNQLLEIEKSRQEEKLALEAEYREFRAETQMTEFERQLEIEDINYQKRLEKLREFLEQKLLTEQEYRALEQAEKENLDQKQNEIKLKDEKKNQKEVEEKYKKNYLAKAAFAADELKLAQFLSNKEVDIAIGGAEKALSAAASSSKEAFAIQKGLSIAKAVIAGVESTIHAWNFGNSIGGPPVGAAFAATSIAFSAAQIAAISSQSFQGGRMAGGNVSANSNYRVGENNKPEMLTIGNDSFLMMGNKGGTVTPNNALGNNGGSGMIITIVNQVDGFEFERNQINDNEMEIIAKRVVASDAPDIMSKEFSNPNSRSSRSLQSNFKVDRRR